VPESVEILRAPLGGVAADGGGVGVVASASMVSGVPAAREERGPGFVGPGGVLLPSDSVTAERSSVPIAPAYKRATGKCNVRDIGWDRIPEKRAKIARGNDTQSCHPDAHHLTILQSQPPCTQHHL
jgi:hypothetical protein